MKRPAPIPAAKCGTIAMVNGGERTHSIVIDEGVLKEWVGIGWIDLRVPTKSDYEIYPMVKR